LLGALGGYAFSALIVSVSITSSGQIVKWVNAASGSPIDIQAAVNTLGSSGGTVYIPAGTYQWHGETVTIPGGVNVIGASLAGCQGHENNWTSYTATTILHNKVPPFNDMFYIDGSNGKQSRISGIQFECDAITGGNDNYIGTAIDGDKVINLRVDHCSFVNFVQIAVLIKNTNTGTASAVIDHCTIDNPYKLSSSGWMWGYGFYAQGQSTTGNGFWDNNAADFFGKYNTVPSGFPVMYVEDCHMSRCRHAVDGIQGGWFTARFNLIDNAYPDNFGQIDLHGTVTGSWLSGRGFEAYNNTIVGVSGNSDNQAVWERDGSALVYNNTFTNNVNSQSNTFIGLYNDDTGNQYPNTHVTQTYIWGNTITNCALSSNSGNYTQNVNYFLRAPTQAQDGFTYIPYAYPHPLTLTGS
jgi:hypothetical protein